MSALRHPGPVDEEEQVRRDRLRRLRAAGVPRGLDRTFLADATYVDLHVILDMLDKGATPEQVCRILL